MDEGLLSNVGMIQSGENWSAGRKIWYSVGGRLMNEYGAMVERYWEGENEVLGEKYDTLWVVVEWKCMEKWVVWYWEGKTEVLRQEYYYMWVVEWWKCTEQWVNETERVNWNAIYT